MLSVVSGPMSSSNRCVILLRNMSGFSQRLPRNVWFLNSKFRYFFWKINFDHNVRIHGRQGASG